MDIKTADLCDQFGAAVSIADPIFIRYGGRAAFGGPLVTLKVYEDNTLVREALSTGGQGQVLVIDGGGSLRCALVGDRLAQLAYDNAWAGMIVYGCIRDARSIATIDIGVRALNTHPRKSVRRGEGQRQIPLTFAGITFFPGHYVYADEDGIIVAERPLIQ